MSERVFYRDHFEKKGFPERNNHLWGHCLALSLSKSEKHLTIGLFPGTKRPNHFSGSV